MNQKASFILHEIKTTRSTVLGFLGDVTYY